MFSHKPGIYFSQEPNIAEVYLFYKKTCSCVKLVCCVNLWGFFFAGGLIDCIKKFVNVEGLVLET